MENIGKDGQDRLFKAIDRMLELGEQKSVPVRVISTILHRPFLITFFVEGNHGNCYKIKKVIDLAYKRLAFLFMSSGYVMESADTQALMSR
jgi:hypothetical protein